MTLEIHEALDRLDVGFRRLKAIGSADLPDTGEIAFEEWDWEVGIGLYGAFRRAEKTGDDAAIARIGRWYDRQIAAGLPRRQINSTAPMLALALLAERLDRPDWRAEVEAWATWIETGMPRTEEGGYQHLVKERDNDGQLWDDSLFMAALFMAAAGRICDRTEWREDAQAQFLTHIRFLGDPATGLFFHGWTFIGRHNYARALWCRGNAWITVAIPELYGIDPPEGAVDRHLRAVWDTQVRALLPRQDATGLWPTLLDDPQSPLEASGSAGIAFGILRGLAEGLASADLADLVRAPLDRTTRAILSRIDTDGLLGEVSDGTAMGPDLDFYRRIPNLPTPYGQALASLFLSECVPAAANKPHVASETPSDTRNP